MRVRSVVIGGAAPLKIGRSLGAYRTGPDPLACRALTRSWYRVTT